MTIEREEDALADIFGDLDNAAKKAPIRSPSPPMKKRKAPTANGATSTDFTSIRPTSALSNASSYGLATSSDPIVGEFSRSKLAGSSSYASETGPSSDGLDEQLFGDLSSRSNKKPRVNGAEGDLYDLNLDTSFDAGEQSMDLELPKKEDDDDNMMQVKAVRTSGNTHRRPLVNVTSSKLAKPATSSQTEEEKAEIKPMTTLKDANKRKAKGLDWQVAAAAATLDTDGDESMNVDVDADMGADASVSGFKAKKFKAPSAGGVSFSIAKVQALEPDGSLRFYWLDYTEMSGILHFIGKVWDRESKKFVSCCVTVEGIDRNLYVLPRQGGVDDYGNDTPAPTEDEVYDEFSSVATKAGIKEWMGKQVDRKYAFELPDVPQEASYLKVLYSYDRE